MKKSRMVLLFSAFASALAGILFGFDTAVIAGTTATIKECYALTENELGFTVSVALIGTVIGAILASYPSDKWGRRDSLKITAFLFFISALWCAFAWDWYSLLVARFVGGLGIGAASVIAPVYIAEIAPAKRRGLFVVMFQMCIVLGFLLAFTSNYIVILQGLDPIKFEWRVMLGVEILPALLFWTFLYFIPRSPRWLVGKGKLEEARKSLLAIGVVNPDAEIVVIKNAIDEDMKASQSQLFRRVYFYPLFLAFSISMFNQLSGINVLWYYMNDIFSAVGFDKDSSALQGVYTSVIMCVFTALAMFTIDKLGRKKLLLIGAAGTGLALCAMTYIYATDTYANLLVYFVMIFMAFFAFSQGAVIWVYISEIFPSAVRAKGQSFGSLTHWGFNAVLAWLFPVVVVYFSKYVPFAFFAVMTLVQFIVVLKFFPETKGVSLEELQKKFKLRKL